MNPSAQLESQQGRGADRFFGKYRGVVSDNNDPQGLGRIRARVPSVLGDQDTGWALPSLPYAGNGVGSYMLPPAGAGVWIEFEAGDASYPIWCGCFWSSGQLPENEQGTGASPPLKILRSESGLMVSIDDDGRTLAVSDSDGSNLLRIDSSSSQVRVQAATKVIIEAPQIELVDGASHPVAFGDDLMSYLNQVVSLFNSHLHPGQLAAGMLPVTPAPPVPPLTPPSPSMLSMKVKAG